MKKINVVLSVSIVLMVTSRLVLHVIMGSGNFDNLQAFLPFYSIFTIIYLVMLVVYATKYSTKKWMGLLVLSTILYPFILDMVGVPLYLNVLEHQIYYGVIGRIIDLVVAFLLLKETKSRLFLVMSVYTGFLLIVDALGLFVEFDFIVLVLTIFTITNIVYVYVLNSRYEFKIETGYDL